MFVSLQNAGKLFRIRVVGGSAAYSYLSPQDSRPLSHPAVDRYQTSGQQNADTPQPAALVCPLHLLQCVFDFLKVKLHLTKGSKERSKTLLVTKQIK